MDCTLFHKRQPVVSIELDDASGTIRKIGAVYAQEHLPVGVPVRHGTVDRAALNTWWADRAIPASRSGIREALEHLEITDTKLLLPRCYGLSLSDQYWICPAGSDLTWDAVNFFENAFSDDIGDVLFGSRKQAKVLNFSSPDNTSDGNLKKRWKIIDGCRCLVKGGSDPFRQQPFNEVIAAGIMERLDIPHVPYTLMWDQDAPYSVCPDFVTDELDLIPAARILQTKERPNHVSTYRHFVQCCEALGIRDIVPFLDRMIALDYIIANEDRHLNNFGLLRNAETLEWLGMAPLYDSGTSLGYNKMPAAMRSEKDVICKPFKTRHVEQLQLISSLAWLDFDRLADVPALIEQTFAGSAAKRYVDTERVHAITQGVQRRIGNLQRMALTNRPAQSVSAENDVTEDVAAAYSEQTMQ